MNNPAALSPTVRKGNSAPARHPLKEVTVFTNGDSSQLSTWSNVPYFFTQSLIEKGIKVNRVDINPAPHLEKLWDKTMGRFWRRLFKPRSYGYFRSSVHFFNVKKRIRRALSTYSASDANIFLTFSFSSAGMTPKPTVLFGDWTYDYHFKHRVGHKPTFPERLCIERENAQIEKADLVIETYPSVVEYMRKTYANRNIHCPGYAVDALYEIPEAEALATKEESYELLFVGSPSYLDGAIALIGAFEMLKPEFPSLTVHIIGMDARHFNSLPAGVSCYGYLDKGRDDHRKLYCEIFKRARIFVHTTPRWGAIGACMEALYCYTPVIMSPYPEFVRIYGADIDFGDYCIDNEPAKIAESIRVTLSDVAYRAKCLNARRAVANHTWSAFMDKIIERIEALNHVGRSTPGHVGTP